MNADEPAPLSDSDTALPRTHLAAERTWLAWWRTGLAATAAGLAVGRLLPEVVGGTTWPYVALGCGYVAVAAAMTLAGGVRQARLTASLRRGSFEALDQRWIGAFTAAGLLLIAATLTIVLVNP